MQAENQCPKCGFLSRNAFSECPRCGIIVEKFLKSGQTQNLSENTPDIPPAPSGRKAEIISFLRESVFRIHPDMNPIAFWGRVLLFGVFVFWGVRFMFASIDSNFVGESFWHSVNLPFHEAGHIIFRPFGQFITSLGGTLGQLLMPLICMTVFLFHTGDAFAASVCLWWFAENFMDIAPYIADARAGVLPLLGGNTGQSSPYGFHDWEYILNETGLLRYDLTIARISYSLGTILMLLSFVWGAYLLWKQYRDLNI
ncbi:MAG: zinc ribbon domain-containing protein [Desulfococcaceae bacterium]|jgi:hypothetical protein|nr:zinc ribbon domain-containing protein [Desulfococcaceae bacterium]